MRRQASIGLGNVVVNVDGMLDRHWPQHWISNLGPVDGRMKKHIRGPTQKIIFVILNYLGQETIIIIQKQ